MKKKVINIEKLIKRAKNGDKEAFCRLILDVQPDLIKYAKTRFNQKEDVEDVLQNTILNAYKNFEQVKHAKCFKSWITHILINNCNDMYKKQKKEATIVQAYINNNTHNSYNSDSLSVNDILKILNDTDKKIFILHHIEKYSIKDIATEMNMPTNTIKSILRRGKHKIREKFKTSTLILFILCLFIVGGVIATSIISLIKNYFETKSTGSNNERNVNGY